MSEAVEIPIVKATEPWNEVELEDGSVLRMKNVVASVHRVEGAFDQEGNPIYIIKAAQATMAVFVPDELRKKT